MSNLPGNPLNDQVNYKINALSPRTLLTWFATHDDTLKQRIETGFSNQKQLSSVRKSYKLNTNSNNSTSKNYMKFKTKHKTKKGKHGDYSHKIYKSKFGMKSERGTSFNKMSSKYNISFVPQKSKQNKDKNSRASNGHSISIESKNW